MFTGVLPPCRPRPFATGSFVGFEQKDMELVRPILVPVDLPRRLLLQHPGSVVDTIYYFESGFCSVVGIADQIETVAGHDRPRRISRSMPSDHYLQWGPDDVFLNERVIGDVIGLGDRSAPDGVGATKMSGERNHSRWFRTDD
jgi:hypothetical protein